MTDELKGRVDQLERQRDHLERELDAYKQRLEMVKKEAVQLANDNAQDKLQIEQLRLRCTTLEEEKDKLQGQRQVSEVYVRELEARTFDVMQQLTSSEAEIKRLVRRYPAPFPRKARLASLMWVLYPLHRCRILRRRGRRRMS